MNLIFNPTKVPRTITRTEWRAIDRWRRVVQRESRKMIKEKIERLYEAALFGIDPAHRATMIDEIINPPVMLGPYQ